MSSYTGREWLSRGLMGAGLLLMGLIATARLTADEPAKAAEPPVKFEKEILAFEAKDKEHAPETGGVVFVGSSSIRMWDTAKAFPGVKLLNRGFGGSQIVDSVRFADRIVIPYRPRLVVFYAGDNDINGKKTPEHVLADYQAFVKKVRTALPETKIAFIAIKPSLSRWSQFETQTKANGLIREFIATDKHLSYIDVVGPMLGADGQPRPQLYKADRLHMTEEGYAIWNAIMKPVLEGSR